MKSRRRIILRSPAYRLADRDVEFLDHDDARGVRLQLEYLKAELLLARADAQDRAAADRAGRRSLLAARGRLRVPRFRRHDRRPRPQALPLRRERA